MSRPQLEVADIIRSAGTDFIERNRSWLRWTHLKVLRASDLPPQKNGMAVTNGFNFGPDIGAEG